jgi:TetR/AcrR family transcriptional regulator, transcriptional repressor for nem operon
MRPRQTIEMQSSRLIKRPTSAAAGEVVEPKAPTPVESRERLLAAASHFFLGGSYHGAGIAEICSMAMVQKGTFYHFFPSKTELLLAVIDRRAGEIDVAIRRIASLKSTAARKIVQLFSIPQVSTNDVQKDMPRNDMPPGYFLGTIVLELASSNPPVQAAAKSAFDRWIRAIEPIIVQLAAEEKLIALDTADAAEAVLGLIQGGAVMASAYSEPRKMRAFGNIALTMLRASASPA